MNLLEMYKELTDEEKQEFIKLIIQEIKKKKKKLADFLFSFSW